MSNYPDDFSAAAFDRYWGQLNSAEEDCCAECGSDPCQCDAELKELFT